MALIEAGEMVDVSSAQSYMQEHGIDAWLVYDFRGSNDVMWQLLNTPASTTRRSILFIPSRGVPQALVQLLDRPHFPTNGNIEAHYYASWAELEAWLRERVGSLGTLALEYSPNCAIPTMSVVDAGMVELIASTGVRITSSADLFQRTVAVWDEQALESHLDASRQVNEILQAAFDLVRSQVSSDQRVSDYDVQRFILDEFARRNLETEHSPVVATNAHSSDPHYEPTPDPHPSAYTQERLSMIREGDWLLIDLWARHPGPTNVFADITWVAYVGTQVPEPYVRVFATVTAARDAVVRRLEEAWAQGETLQGWQLDDVARELIRDAGYGDRFIHRTGHSIGPGSRLQALGVNLDNFETHDTRTIEGGVGFSVEPGVYLDEFGVRSEINVFIHPEKGPQVTTPAQESIVLLGDS
jgi:Xaa-Pro dipeptidase